MDMAGMEPKAQVLRLNRLDQRGQSMVEYILLLAVVISLAGVVFKSDFWLSYFGPEGKFDQVFRARMEYSYRHSLEGDAFYAPPNYQTKNHDSYFYGGSTRFFIPTDPYPKE